MAELNDRVVPLEDLDDFEVAEGDPDVRGWDVVASGGSNIGKVDQLLVDTAAQKVRYLSVELASELRSEDEDQHILVPIGYALLHEDDDKVLVAGLDRARISSIPTYGREPVTRDYELTVVKAYDPDYDGRAEDIYTHTLYDEDKFYAPRRG